MLFQNFNVFFRTKSKFLCSYIHRYIFRMDKAYMRRVEGSDTFDLSFKYVNPTYQVDRQFNFTRKVSESVETLLTRITVNVEKVLNKKMKRKKNDQEKIVGDSIKLYQNGKDVNGAITCEDLFLTGGDIRLQLIDNEYRVVINTPWIKSIALPTCILANYYVYPIKFETLFVEKTLSDYTWYTSKDKQTWTEATSQFLYTPQNNDINSYIKLSMIPKNTLESGPGVEIISDVTVQANPGKCPFETRQEFTKEKLKGKEFRVVTYNLLADLYADSDYSRAVLFPYCPEYALNIDYRKQLILKELIGYNSDIICLQEVDEKIFLNDLQPVLGYSGFEGVYDKKGNTAREGLACFYNSNRFELIDNKQIVLGEELESPMFTDVYAQIQSNEKLKTRISERTTSLQIVILKSTENNEHLVIANTHFYFHPDADHIRLLQGTICIKYLAEVLRKTENEFSSRASLIFCGDFNSVPDCGTYKLYTEGSCPADIVDWQSNKEESVTGIDLKQNLIMSSACGTPKYTNYTPTFKDCLDYIFYQKSNFEVSQVIPLPSEEEMALNIAIPSVVFPSDHISLVADLRLL